MLERVYGRQTPDQLALVIARAMGLTQGVCSTFVSAPTETPDPVDALDDDGSNAASSPASEKLKAHQDLRPDGPVSARVEEVPGPGIEPGTRGFSGLVREWPRPRDPLEKRRRRGATEAHLCQPDAGSEQLDFGFEDPGRPAG